LLRGFGCWQATAEVSSEGRLSGEDDRCRSGAMRSFDLRTGASVKTGRAVAGRSWLRSVTPTCSHSRARWSIRRASIDPRKAGTAMANPQNRYSNGQRLCEVGSTMTSETSEAVCVTTIPSKIASGIRRSLEPINSRADGKRSRRAAHRPARPLRECEYANSRRNEDTRTAATQAAQMAGYVSSSVGPLSESPFLINSTSESAPITNADSATAMRR
jgi:hypothetical protein